MDDKAKKRLIHIRDTTKVNKQHAEDYKRKKTEFYDNRSINYRKHIRW